jgi:hypothetical protein
LNFPNGNKKYELKLKYSWQQREHYESIKLQ